MIRAACPTEHARGGVALPERFKFDFSVARSSRKVALVESHRLQIRCLFKKGINFDEECYYSAR